MVVAIIMIVAINAFLGGMVWRTLFIKPKFDVIIFEDAMIIVGELDSYYHKQVQFLSRPDAPLGNHIVEVYLFNSKCDSVPTTIETQSCERSNVSENQNFTHLYLLPKSSLNYTITPSVVTSGSDSVKGYVYITFGPELDQAEFNPRTCQNSDCTIKEHKPFTDQESIEHSYTVTKRGYYNLHSVSIKPLSQYQYTLGLTVNASTIKLPYNATKPACIIQDINGGDGTCPIDLTFKVGKVCLVAYTKAERSAPHHYIGLEAKVTKLQLEMVLVTTVVPSVAAAIIIISLCMCLLITCWCVKTRRENDQYEVLRSIGT